jgi:hypothetical protein
MKTSGLFDQGKEMVDEAAEKPEKGRGRKAVYMRSNSLEPVRGHIFKLDPSLLILNDILRDKELRRELEETLGRLHARMEGRQRKTQKTRRRIAK